MKKKIAGIILAGTMLAVQVSSPVFAASKYEFAELPFGAEYGDTQVMVMGSSADDSRILFVDKEAGEFLIFDKNTGSISQLQSENEADKEVVLKYIQNEDLKEKLSGMSMNEIMTDLIKGGMVVCKLYLGMPKNGDEVVLGMETIPFMAVNIGDGTYTFLEEFISDINEDYYMSSEILRETITLTDKKDGHTQEVSLTSVDGPCNRWRASAFLSDQRIAAVTTGTEIDTEKRRENAVEIIDASGEIKYYPIGKVAFAADPNYIIASEGSDYVMIGNNTYNLGPILVQTETGEMSVLDLGEKGFEKRSIIEDEFSRENIMQRKEDYVIPLYSLNEGEEFLVYIGSDSHDNYERGAVVALNPETLEAEEIFVPDKSTKDAGNILKWSESFTNSSGNIYSKVGFLDNFRSYLEAQ